VKGKREKREREDALSLDDFVFDWEELRRGRAFS
jgi:hypothetical protein